MSFITIMIWGAIREKSHGSMNITDIQHFAIPISISAAIQYNYTVYTHFQLSRSDLTDKHIVYKIDKVDFGIFQKKIF